MRLPTMPSLFDELLQVQDVENFRTSLGVEPILVRSSPDEEEEEGKEDEGGPDRSGSAEEEEVYYIFQSPWTTVYILQVLYGLTPRRDEHG